MTPAYLLISIFKDLLKQAQKHLLLAFKHTVQNVFIFVKLFTLQYIILYFINRHVTYKFCWSRNKLREVNLNSAGVGTVSTPWQG